MRLANGEDQEVAIDKLTQTLIWVFPDFQKELVTKADVSYFRVGAVL